jgi:hypothetical protein
MISPLWRFMTSPPYALRSLKGAAWYLRFGAKVSSHMIAECSGSIARYRCSSEARNPPPERMAGSGIFGNDNPHPPSAGLPSKEE